ncbi:MAG: ATP-binding cassette domain-containing protein [Candidatus Neomarinimicrobiota bacterium]
MYNSDLFTLEQVSYTVRSTVILNHLSFSVAHGEFLGLLGPSGSGKTSLLRLFNGLDQPSTGNIEYSGKSIARWDIRLLRQQVGMVFQEPVILAGSVRDNLLLIQRWDKTLAPVSDLDLYQTLEKVGLQTIELKTDARSLSGGEKQRLALARVLLNRPQVLLLDEPTASLDRNLARRIVRRIADLHREMNLTIIMVSHDPELVRRFASRVLFLAAGQIVEDGPIAILDHPVTTALQAYLAEEH